MYLLLTLNLDEQCFASNMQQNICNCLASAASRIEDLPPRHLNCGTAWLIHYAGKPVGSWEFKKGEPR